MFRPATVIFVFGTLAVGAAVWYLAWLTGGPDLPPPKVTYSVLPNEGKSNGVPVVVKVNQLAVMMIDDPMESGTATRAQAAVTAIEQAIQKAQGNVGVRFAVEIIGGRPAILEVNQNGPDSRTLVTVTPGDVALAGETDATRLASRWAERLTDAVKVFVFGERPNFSTGTEFGDALLLMYKTGLDSRGKASKKFLDRAFERLAPERRRALETPPKASS